jgi:hypothetical protein
MTFGHEQLDVYRDRIVAMLTRLGQRGYSVREGPDVCGSDDVESDFDSDSDTDNDFKSAGQLPKNQLS